MALLSTKTGLPSFSDVDQSIINIVDNPSARRDTTGWTAATNYSVTRDISNSPLAGVIDTCFAISTTTASTESSTSGVYAASLAMPAALRNSKVQGNLWVTVPATSAGVWRLSVYNASGTRVTLDRDSAGVWTLPGGYTGQLPFTFYADSSATYTISFTQTTRTSANTLYYTLVSIGNGNVSQTAAVGATGTSSSPTFPSGTPGVTPTSRIQWQRVGDNLKLEATMFFSGTGTGTGDFSLALPISGITAISGSYGGAHWKYANSGTDEATRNAFVLADGTANLKFSEVNTPSTAITTNGLGTSTSQRSYLVFSVSIPIAEWAGTVSTGPAPAEEFLWNSTAWGTSNSTAFAYGPSGGAITGALGGTLSYRVRAQYAIQSDDEIQLEFASQAGGPWQPASGFSDTGGINIMTPICAPTAASDAVGVEVRRVSGSTTDLDIVFGRRSWARFDNSATRDWQNGWYWRVRKTKKAALPFANAGTDGSAGLYKAGQAPGLKTGVAIGSDYVGEVRKSLITALTSGTTSATYFDATSISLPAGIWSVTASVNFERNGVTFSSTNFVIGLNTTSGNSSAGFAGPSNTASSAATIPTSFTRHALWINNTIIRSDGTTLTLEANNTAYATGTTLYLKTYMDTYASGTPQYTCYLQAVRIA